MIRRPWVIQAWLLHVVYGFYFASLASASSISRGLLQTLVDVCHPSMYIHQPKLMCL
jgi:hypothetical protein